MTHSEAREQAEKEAGYSILAVEDIDRAIRILSVHAYSKEQMDEIGEDISKIDDSFAYDHAVCIMLLGGELQ